MIKTESNGLQPQFFTRKKAIRILGTVGRVNNATGTLSLVLYDHPQHSPVCWGSETHEKAPLRTTAVAEPRQGRTRDFPDF